MKSTELGVMCDGTINCYHDGKHLGYLLTERHYKFGILNLENLIHESIERFHVGIDVIIVTTGLSLAGYKLCKLLFSNKTSLVKDNKDNEDNNENTFSPRRYLVRAFGHVGKWYLAPTVGAVVLHRISRFIFHHAYQSVCGVMLKLRV